VYKAGDVYELMSTGGMDTRPKEIEGHAGPEDNGVKGWGDARVG
jgi:hypothetical protein